LQLLQLRGLIATILRITRLRASKAHQK